MRLKSLLALALLSIACGAHASDTTVSTLLTKELVVRPDQEITMLTVEYAPGASSAKHRHDGQVLVYVLEGTLNMQVDGQGLVTLKPGQTFYENPDDVHLVSANASKTERAKFLVVMVKAKQKK
ncbi:MAG: cupin domain-containing protein [Steroidobacter sp.]